MSEPGESPSSSSNSSATEFVRNVNLFMRCDDDIGAFDEPNESHQLPAEDVTTVNAGHPGSITGSFAGVEDFPPPAEEEEAARRFQALQAAHADGTCEPCVLHTSTLGCHKGDRCAYCHLPHPLESSSSTRGVRKHTRDSIRHRVLALLRPPIDLDAVHQGLQDEAARHVYGRKMVHQLLEATLQKPFVWFSL